MLQIASGRFFGGVERFDRDNKAGLFSTATLDGPLSFGPFMLVAAQSTDGAPYELAFPTGMPIPAGGPRAGVMVSTGDREVGDQFCALMTVFSDRLWSTEAGRVRRERPQGAHRTPDTIPGLAAPAVVSAARAAEFFEQALRLPRARYLQVSEAARTLDLAIRVAALSYDAAHALVVFAIESLVPDDTVPTWDHYPDKVRRAVDRALERADASVAEDVRAALTGDSPLKLQARFTSFVEGSLGPAFHRTPGACPRSHLKRAIRNAYSHRSAFVHALNAPERPMGGWGLERTFTWGEGGPHLTLRGLFTIAWEVVRSVVRAGPHSDREDGVPWGDQLPGVGRAQWAHQYWIHHPNVFVGSDLRRRFSEVVEYAYLLRVDPESDGVANFGTGIAEAAKGFANLRSDDKRRLLGIGWIWRCLVREDASGGLLERELAMLESPSVETLVLVGWRGLGWTDPADVGLHWWRHYVEQRYANNAIRVPHAVESTMRAVVASKFLDEGDGVRFVSLCDEIADDEGARPDVLAHVLKSAQAGTKLDLDVVLGIPLPPVYAPHADG